MVWKPDVTVAAVVERDGQFLFVEERASGRVVLNQPAGHLENGETFLEAVARETLEETGWTFVPLHVVGVYVWQPEHLSRTFLRVAFAGRLEGHDPSRPLDHGILRTRWLDRAQLGAAQARHRSPLVARCVDDYLAGIRYPLALVTHLMRPRDDENPALAASG
jgi:8-oxo-dGTP pyrophosphatase MutT (NUDIX family)